VPRGEADSFSRVDLTLLEPGFSIGEVEVLDRAGNLMRYRLFDLRRNAGLSDHAFHFEPPPGTEVVRP